LTCDRWCGKLQRWFDGSVVEIEQQFGSSDANHSYWVTEGSGLDDVFATCREEIARLHIRDGVFEWQGYGLLADGSPVTLEFGWQPDFDGPFPNVLVAFRAA